MISVVPSNLVVYHSMNKFAFKRMLFMLETGHQSFYFILFFIIVCLKISVLSVTGFLERSDSEPEGIFFKRS